MRYLIIMLTTLMLFGCGTDFYLNKEPMMQKIIISQMDKSLTLSAKSLIEDNIIRIRLESEFYRGNAEIIYENGYYHMTYTNLPLDSEKTETLKGDLYAAFFAGDFPYSSDDKMFGDVIMKNGIKLVKDTDGYLLYRITYNGTEMTLYNIVKEYNISIYSEKSFRIK
ncbi:MAG: hypothetical protein C0602_02560 [Denitrovibrio sp.]|nr:MAG: hypothetical protein C0602_02560 [Denitrovibrio sp.]